MRSLVVSVLLLSAVAGAEPTKVFIGTHIIEMRNIDQRAESFWADFYLWMRFEAKDAEQAAQIIDKLEPLNGKFESKEIADRKQIGNETYICFRMMGTFFFQQDLRKYPFDTQALDIYIENSNLEVADMIFVDDRETYTRSGEAEQFWGVDPHISIPEFKLKRVDRMTTETIYKTDFGDPTRKKSSSTYSRFTVKVSFEREYWSYFFKIVLPLLVILGMAYLVFYIPPNQLETAGAVSATALLSCMAYNIVVSSNLPEIGYLVISDKFFIGTYVLLFLTLAETFATFVLDDRGEKERARKIEKTARWLFPVMVAMLFAFLSLGAR